MKLCSKESSARPSKSVLLCLLAVVAGACRAGVSAPSQRAGTGESCETGRRELLSVLERLPDRALASSVGVELPRAALGGSLGPGPVLEISEQRVRLDGEAIPGGSVPERLKNLEPRLAGLSTNGAEAPTLYVAASKETDVRTLRRYLALVPRAFRLRLIFGAPPLPADSEGEQSSHALAASLLAERDPTKRRELARTGYHQLAECSSIREAAASTDGLSDSARWPALRNALQSAVQACPCDSFDSAGLQQLVVAEQRAGSMAFGALPLTFLKDERCGASMPLRSLQKLLDQIEQFDAEFSGDWQRDALAFDRVITDERLLNYFCDALPGETLAALAKERATLYWRASQDAACQAWTFEPLSPGAPMGTWRRRATSDRVQELTLHYWQGAEEIRMYGPGHEQSKPTDEHSWPCEQTLRMVSVDESSISLESGRWFFSESACLKAPAAGALVPGCIGRLVAGDAPSESGEGAAPPPR